MAAETYSLNQIKAESRITTATPWYRHITTGPIGSYVPEKYMLENVETADQAFATVLAKAGTVNRDKVETRVINDTRNGVNANRGGTLGNGIIDVESQAEGFFAYPSATAKTDTDGDGMPDEWEKANGLNPELPDNNLVNSDGYTALEAYLNSLMGESYADDFKQTSITTISISSDISYDSSSATLILGNDAIGATLTVYSTDGRIVSARRIADTSVSLASLPAGIYLARVHGQGIHPAVIKIAR